MNNSPPITDDLDLGSLKESIRLAVTRRRAARGPVAPAPLDWSAVLASIARVEALADIAAGPPELPRLRGVWRSLGRLAARGVLFLTRFLTNRQRECNHALLAALTNLHSVLRRLEEKQDAELRALREELACGPRPPRSHAA